MKRPSRSGFTLIELLAVVALITIVIAFAVPATSNMIRSTQMTQAAQQVNDIVLYARQLALSKSRPIEVRFYKYSDPDTPGEAFDKPEAGKWRAIQLFEVLENGATLPVQKMVRLPNGVIMHHDEYSTLLRESLRGHVDAETDITAPEIPVDVNNKRVAKHYWYTSFRYLPDGSTDLPSGTAVGSEEDTANDNWYFSLVGLTDDAKDIKDVNYFTLQVDPVSGTLKSFRPTVQ